MKNYILEGALVVSIVRVPEFGEVIVGNSINEEVVEKCLHCKVCDMSSLLLLCVSLSLAWQVAVDLAVTSEYRPWLWGMMK